MPYLNFIEQYNDLVNEHYGQQEEDDARVNANDIHIVDYQYRCDPSISGRLGIRRSHKDFLIR